MKLVRILPFLLLYFWLTATGCLAQTGTDSTTTYRLETTDGNEYLGNILEQDTEKVRFKTQKLGTLTIARTDIKSLTAVSPGRIKNGNYWFDNPQATRYLFSPNGYGLQKGEGYYQNVWVFVNQVSVGITNNFSVGAGMVPIFLFGGPTPIWILPKFSMPVVKDKFNIGAGALIGTVLNTQGDDYGEADNSGFGIAYGLATFGSRDKNLSVGLGYGYAAGEWSNSPTVTLNGLIRTGSRGYFITENYLISAGSETLGLISLGGRRIIKRAGIDFGLVIPVGVDTGGTWGIPFLGLTVPFGQKNNTGQQIKP